MPTLFLSGGTGFVGSHVAREFLARGWRVRALVRWPQRPGLLPGEVETVRGDLLDTGSYGRHLTGCTAVVHCAGATRARNLEQFRRVNVAGTEALVKVVSEACPEAMFIHVSSQAAAGPSRDGVPLRETDPPDPVSWYGRSKLEGELAVARHCRGRWCVVRPSIVYGAGDPGLLSMFAVVARGLAPLPGGGRRRVQLLAVEDLSRILFAAAQRPDLHGRRAFAAGETVTMGDLVREVAGLRTPRARTVAVPAAALRLLGVVAWLGEGFTHTVSPFNRDKVREILQTDWLCETDPFLRDLQIRPTTRWQDGIRHACRWYIEAQWLSPRAFASV